MKNLKKVLALVLAVVMIMGVVSVASAKTYTDVKATDDYATAIDILSNLNILDGFKDGDNYSFKADGTFTRAQAAKIVAIVHNAATNGTIKGQDAISELYSNAQNPFVDCNNSWALPFINYCRITGLADGMTATTYAPNRELTGVQWLKLMLTTLNFDTAKEGYTGTGWDVNVLNRANEIGLTAGLADGWKAIAPITRGEAAQILYNALTAYLVEYGQKVKNTVTTEKVYTASFIANEQVSATGYTLGGKMGISIERTTDSFRRPGYTWSYGSWSAFYMDTPVNSYTTAVTMCDILKNDMGVKETSTKEIKLNAAVNTTKLNYFAVDGYQYADVVLKHDSSKNCQKITGEWYKSEFGGQGDLTQVFETEDGWVITTIHTFLAKVDSFTGTNRKSHATKDKATAEVYLSCKDEPTYDSTEGDSGWIWTTAKKSISTTDYAEGTKILVTMSLKDTETANKALDYAANAAIVDVTAADSKVGKLTGASGVTYADTTSIDGTKYNDNCRLVLGKDLTKNRDYNGETFKFYFDAYGNVIGAENTGSSTDYLVIDRMWSETPNGKFAVKADLVLTDATAVEGATIKFGPFADEKLAINSLTISTDDRFNTWAEKQLYSYTVEDGVYTLTYAGVFEDNWGAGMIKAFYRHSAGEAYIDDVDVERDDATYSIINISESTVFLCEDMAGKYASYTGYSKLPALSAQYLDYVDDNGDGYADVVYLGDVTYASDKIIGFVAKWNPFSWSGSYDLVTVYVNGEATVVNVPADYQGENTEPGLYEFEMATDKDGNVYADIINAKQLRVDYYGLYTISADKTAIQLGAPDVRSIGLTGKSLYLVNADYTVEAIEAKDMILYDHVLIYADDSGKIVALYVLDLDIDMSDYTG